MKGSIRHLVLAAVAALALHGAAQAQAPAAGTAVAPPTEAAVGALAPKGPPAGFVAPAEPKADENNAQRGKTQPGNNAPFWRGVRDSGTQEGFITLPGVEKGVLVRGKGSEVWGWGTAYGKPAASAAPATGGTKS